MYGIQEFVKGHMQESKQTRRLRNGMGQVIEMHGQRYRQSTAELDVQVGDLTFWFHGLSQEGEPSRIRSDGCPGEASNCEHERRHYLSVTNTWWDKVCPAKLCRGTWGSHPRQKEQNRPWRPHIPHPTGCRQWKPGTGGRLRKSLGEDHSECSVKGPGPIGSAAPSTPAKHCRYREAITEHWWPRRVASMADTKRATTKLVLAKSDLVTQRSRMGLNSPKVALRMEVMIAFFHVRGKLTEEEEERMSAGTPSPAGAKPWQDSMFTKRGRDRFVHVFLASRKLLRDAPISRFTGLATAL